MCSKIRLGCSPLSLFVICFVFACMTLELGTMISAYPTASVGVSSSDVKLEGDKTDKESADLSFEQFINMEPHTSTFITELKPNANVFEKKSSMDKIAEAISKTQETDKKKAPSSVNEATGRPLEVECYIQITMDEKVAGKCNRAKGGLPICETDVYMSIDAKECS